MTWQDDAKKQIEFDEGRRYRPYRDSLGIETIGIGINLANGLYDNEIDFLRDNRFDLACRDLDRAYPWWVSRPDSVRCALVNMTYNMGISRLGGFSRMLSAIHAGDYETAAKEALDSAWAAQVGDRADRIAGLIRRGGQ